MTEMPDAADVQNTLENIRENAWGSPDLEENTGKQITDIQDEDAGIDVRLQVWEDGGWVIHTGDASPDQDHGGFWGSGYLSLNTDCADLANDLISQALDHASQCQGNEEGEQ